MKIHLKSAVATVLVAVAVLLSSTGLLADVTGSITGVVHDPRLSVVTGATVQVTNVQTNVSQQATTGADGAYHFLALSPGNYKITATASGFRAYNATDITLQVNDQLRIDIALQVGTVAETIDVSASAVHVETENTQVGDVIDSKKMLALPLNGRSYLDLLGLQAGVAPTTAGTVEGNTQSNRPVSGYITNTGNVSVNGQRETANAFLVNGGDVSEGRNLGAGLIPNLDSVEEFRLITNSFDAEYGKFSGAVMITITKSGTNGIHGDAFYFWRNDTLDARGFFDPSKAELRRHQFGYAVGGPFWKNKLFWFTDYQGTREVRGASTGAVTVPTANQQKGIFTPADFADSSGNPLLVNSQPCPGGATCGLNWADALTSRLGYTVVNNEPYSTPACNTTDYTSPTGCVFPNGVIPSSAFSTPAIKILPYIPLG